MKDKMKAFYMSTVTLLLKELCWLAAALYTLYLCITIKSPLLPFIVRVILLAIVVLLLICQVTLMARLPRIIVINYRILKAQAGMFSIMEDFFGKGNVGFGCGEKEPEEYDPYIGEFTGEGGKKRKQVPEAYMKDGVEHYRWKWVDVEDEE